MISTLVRIMAERGQTVSPTTPKVSYAKYMPAFEAMRAEEERAIQRGAAALGAQFATALGK